MANQVTVTGTVPIEKTLENIPIEEIFWSYIKEHINQNEEAKKFNKTEFEQRLRTSFGRNLKEQINTYFHGSWHGNGNKLLTSSDLETKALAGFFFEVTKIEYNSNSSSIELKLNISGIEKLVELFDKDFELFESVLRSYILSAFEATIPIYSGFPDWKLEINEDVQNAFGTKDKGTPFTKKTTENSTLKRLTAEIEKWLLIIGNIPLMVPLILILAVLIAYAWNQSNILFFDNFKQRANDDLIREQEILKQDRDWLNSILKKIIEEKAIELKIMEEKTKEKNTPSPSPSPSPSLSPTNTP